MAEVVGVVAAALQFADVALKLIKLAREIHSGAEPGVDDALMEKILKQCISTVTDLDNRLRRVDVAKGDGWRKKTQKAFLAQWDKDDVEELFRQLNRDQMALLLHRNFSSDKARDYFEHLLDKYGSKAVSLEKGLLVQAIRYDDDPGFGVRRFSSALLAVATDARAIYGSELDQALIKAAKLPGVTEMIQVLVKKGADPNAADEEGNTALHYAAKRTDPGGRSALARVELEVDKTLLQLLAIECREGDERGMRALEMVELMRDRTGRMVDAAVKVAERYGRTLLGEKIRELGDKRANGMEEDW
ncbi:hypothetical protein BN1708_000315 [Verticillium longisporum]|uniref:WDHD1/CFT4 helical bundle domain-containing protein n=2 Tax=Verticillium longisporum TaxID=100787 RepID=A0A0G4KDA8_VERLO|nr:hypothetical protein BN1708_000315 [Verticillium longisporum]